MRTRSSIRARIKPGTSSMVRIRTSIAIRTWMGLRPGMEMGLGLGPEQDQDHASIRTGSGMGMGATIGISIRMGSRAGMGMVAGMEMRTALGIVP